MYTFTYGCSTGPFGVECQLSLVAVSRGYSLVAVPGLFLAGASCVAVQGL